MRNKTEIDLLLDFHKVLSYFDLARCRMPYVHGTWDKVLDLIKEVEEK